MMFSAPSTFNDPYDCRPVFIRGENPAKDRAAIGRAWDEGRRRAGNKKPSPRERSQHISRVIQELSTPDGAAAHFEPVLDDRTGVFCMSKDWRLLTQWAYYAENGKGLCLEYDVQPNSGFDRVFEVQYTSERPQVHVARLLDDREYRTQALFNAVTHKAPDWSHEREVRALHSEPGLLPHPAGMLSSIMIGHAADDRDADWLLEHLRPLPNTITVYRTMLSSRSFTLERQKLNS